MNQTKNQPLVRRGVCILLVLAMLFSICPAVFAANVANINAPDGRVLIAQTNYDITPGMTESQIVLNNTAGNSQVLGYMATITPDAEITLKASYGNYYSKGSTVESRAALAAKGLNWDLKTTTAQAKNYEAATGQTVVTAINADYYNMQSGQCSGYLVMEGNLIQTHRLNDAGAPVCEPYFAVLKDGSYEIRDYGTPTDDVVEAVSGPFYLVKDGQIDVGQDTIRAPRNSIGLKADGTVIVLLADGRQGVSDGMTFYEMAQILLSQGCVDALYLDGGGSATYASRHEGGSLQIQNHPSDGAERVVASSLLVVSTAKETGVFDHASLSPNNKLYIPGSEVQFTADGVDASGYPADLPSGLTWSLEDTAYGTIDNTGLFQSNGKCGTVSVRLMQGKTVVGSTSIEVQEPDKLEFAASSMNLSFNQTTDFGLSVIYNNRSMELTGYTFDWTVKSTTDGVSDKDIGSFDGNYFTAVKAKQTLTAEVTVSYTKADKSVLTDTISVEIGRMPQVFLDFEPDENGKVGAGVAQYDWGKATANPDGYMPKTNPLSFLAWVGDEETGSPQMTEPQYGPFFFDGTYIEKDPAAKDLCYYPAASIFSADGYDFMTNHTGVMQVGSAAGDIVTAENGQVRFGDYALRWDYDYTVLSPGYKNVNMWLMPTEDIELEGTPSGLGFWAYAPEGTDNFWLWLRVSYYNEDGNLTSTYVHVKTQEGRSVQYNGIYWDGWMYCEADLSGLAKYVTPDRPITLPAGQYFVCLTFIPGGSVNENGDKIPMGAFSAGSLYFDNFRTVYGDTVDDMEKPEISAVSANGTALAEDGSTVITDNAVTITSTFLDPVNDNTTGINTEKTTIYVDGQRQTLTKSTETQAAASVTLPNGTHSVTVTVLDGFGNQNTVTRYFTVNDADSAYGTVTLSGEDTAVVGETYALKLVSNGSDKISAVTAQISINNSFGEPTVTFTEGCTGESKLENGVLTLDITKTAGKAGELATISFEIDPATPQGTLLNYSVKTGSFVDNAKTLTFSQNTTAVGLSSAYNISADVMTVGGNGKIYVTKADGSTPGRVKIYQVADGQDDILVGTTNSSGVLVTNRFCQTVGESFTIYAQGDLGLSFQYSSTTTGLGSDEVAPTNVRLNAVPDPSNSQSISWFSAQQYTEKKAVVEYVEKTAYDSGSYTFQSATGTCTTQSFTGDNASTQINTVTLSGLKAGTSYCYRVGDGVDGHWSDVKQFTTSVSQADTTFFVLADTQLTGNAASDTEDIETLRQLLGQINETDARFGVQTGDFIDDAGKLGSWNEILGIFSEDIADLSIVQVMGNHEYYGDVSGSHAETIFDLPDEDYYSVEYGNVYIAVINCNASLDAAAKWLVQDAAKTDCEWKVVTLHQPPYYTNPKGSSAAYNEVLPSVIDEAGIDFVFSGHDHAYARTEPLTGGKVDKEEGAVYFICGDLGEKSRSTEYTPDNNPDFHFATISQDYDAVYLIANTSGNDMTVTAYNLDGTVLDSYTMHHTTACEAEGHHYVYNRATNNLSCSVCQDAPANYTGWATDTTGGRMYFLAGTYATGWLRTGLEISDYYHFDERTGIAHKVTITEDVPTTCTTRGHYVLTCECGEVLREDYEAPLGHHFEEHTRPNGTTYYVCTGCGMMSSYDLPFIDVTENDWFIKEVDYVYQNQYFTGTTSSTFSPKDPMDRSMLVTVLWRLAGKPNQENNQTVPYSDCSANMWYTAALNWASENGIVTGYPGGKFGPKDATSREQIATFLYRFAEYLKLDTSARADLSSFGDANRVSDFAKDAMSWAVANKLINGVPGNLLAPKNTASRAEVAALVMRFQLMREKMEADAPAVPEKAVEATEASTEENAAPQQPDAPAAEENVQPQETT